MKKKVMVFGTFDGVHDGHRAFLEEAKEQGDHLVIVIARDQSIAHVYGETPQLDEIDRVAHILNEGIAEDVVMGYTEDKARVIKDHAPDIIVLGFSQKKYATELLQQATRHGLPHVDVRLGEPHKPEVHPPSKYTKFEIHVD